MINKDHIQGTWKLLSWQILYGDDQVANPYGEFPNGQLIYSHDGYMSAQLSTAQRPSLGGSSIRRLTDDQRRELLEGFFAYAGRYSVHNNKITHHVTQSMNPDFIGHDQVRDASLNADVLTLQGEETDGKGNKRLHVLKWQRFKTE